MVAMDAVQRAVARRGARLHDGHGNPVGHRPGYVIDSSVNRSAITEAYRQYEDEITNAWRGCKSASPERASHDRPIQDDLQSAYLEYEQHITNAWRTP